MKPIAICLLVLCLVQGCAPPEKSATDPVALSEDFQSWEDTEKPAGSAAYLGLGSYAKVFCTAVFESGREPEEAFANSNGLLLPPELQPHVRYTVEEEARRTILTIGDSISRVATYFNDQGCILDVEKGLFFEPKPVVTSLPPGDDQPWPMGDIVAPVGASYDRVALEEVADLAFDSAAYTAAFLVIHKGEIIVERYRPGITYETQLESWSMGKSLTGTLVARLMQQGKLQLDDLAPIAEWQREGDPRRNITIRNLYQMSSGLRFPSHHDPEVKVPIAQLTHMYVYTGSINVFDFAVNRPLEFIPGSTGRYRNSDPLALGYILKTTLERTGEDYLTWPQRQLFDKIGIRRQMLETDRYGNFIMSGYDYGTARNWGRLGLLYLNDGSWGGTPLLPEGFVDFVRKAAPGWEHPEYGGLFWLNGTGTYQLPADAYAMRGGGGQNTIIVPSMDLVVVRMGHAKGAPQAAESLNRALAKLTAYFQTKS